MIADLKKKYDFVITNIPPNFQGNAFKATLASDFIIILSSPSLSDQKALLKSMEIAEECKKPCKLLAVRTQKRHKLSQELLKSIAELNGFKINISLRSCIIGSQFHGLWVGAYQPHSDSHQEFKALGKEILEYMSA